MIGLKLFSLKNTYILVFTILAAWAIFAYLTMSALISSQERYAKLINLSGKQRMLSQKTTLMVKRYSEASNHEIFLHLKDLVRTMKKDHQFIMKNLTSDKMKNIYKKESGLDAEVKKYFMLLEKFMQKPNLELERQIQEFSFNILPRLNTAVYAFEDESNAAIETLEQRELFILIGTLLTLIFEIIFLVRPVVRMALLKNQKLKELVEDKTKSLEMYLRVFETAMEGMMILDRKGKILSVNDSFSKITKYKAKDVLGKSVHDFRSSYHDEKFYKSIISSLNKNGFWKGEIVSKTKAKRVIHEWFSIIKYSDQNSHSLYYLVVFYDITQQYEAKKHLEYVATHDYLTGLPNRNLFNDRLEHALALAKRNQTRVLVIFIDLDDFKIINDTQGHDKGDLLLKELANRLDKNVRESDTVARIGGDEFVIIAEEVNNLDRIANYLEHIQKILREPVYLDNIEITSSASLGVSIFPDDAVNAKSLVQFADTAMYHSKDGGKGRYSFFTKELNQQITLHLEIEKALTQAIKNEEFEIFIQPKIDIQNNKITGGEVLLRWQKNKNFGFVPPDVFIPIAEKVNQIYSITSWVIEESLRCLRSWEEDEVLKDLTLAVNVSSKQFYHISHAKEMIKLIEDSKIAPKIEIEITESTLMSNIEVAIKTLTKLHEIGSKISVDDFGTGYSSLSYLKRLPIDNLKIDKSFVFDLCHDDDSRSIVKSILILADSLNLKVIAEGVETEFENNFMKEHGCNEVQGYFYSKPMSVQSFEKWVKGFNK